MRAGVDVCVLLRAQRNELNPRESTVRAVEVSFGVLKSIPEGVRERCRMLRGGGVFRNGAVISRLQNASGQAKPEFRPCIITSIPFNVMTGANTFCHWSFVTFVPRRGSSRVWSTDKTCSFFFFFFWSGPSLSAHRSIFHVFSFVHSLARSVNSVGGERTSAGRVVVDLEVVQPEVPIVGLPVLVDQVLVPLPSPLDRNSLLVVADH